MWLLKKKLKPVLFGWKKQKVFSVVRNLSTREIVKTETAAMFFKIFVIVTIIFAIIGCALCQGVIEGRWQVIDFYKWFELQRFFVESRNFKPGSPLSAQGGSEMHPSGPTGAYGLGVDVTKRPRPTYSTKKPAEQ